MKNKNVCPQAKLHDGDILLAVSVLEVETHNPVLTKFISLKQLVDLVDEFIHFLSHVGVDHIQMSRPMGGDAVILAKQPAVVHGGERREKNGSGWTQKNRNRLLGKCAGCEGSGGIIETESCSYALSIGEKNPYN